MKIKWFIQTITVLCVTIGASCSHISSSTEYNEDEAIRLIELHTNPSDYSTSEIREIETQVELYVQQLERDVDKILDSSTESQKKRMLYNFMLEFNESPPTIGKMIRILQNNSKADKAKIRSIQNRAASTYMMIEKEL